MPARKKFFFGTMTQVHWTQDTCHSMSSIAMDNLGSMMPKLQQTGLATAFFRG